MRNPLLVIVLAGCLPDVPQSQQPPPPPPDETPRETFDRVVSPALDAHCASCHVGDETTSTNMFLGQQHTSDSYYAGITSDEAVDGDFNPAAASMLTKGTHEGSAWDATDKANISSWLVAEAAARMVPTPPPPRGGRGGSGAPTSALDAERQGATCRGNSLSEYQGTTAYAIADLQTQNNNGPCYSCHEPGGAGGAYWGTNPNNTYTDMLAKWQQQVFITGPFQAVVQNTSPATYKMQTARNKICAKGQERNNGGGEHPTFDCNGTADGVVVLDALDAFTLAVQQKIDNGECPAPYAFAAPN